jgi:hypothetical protein
LTSRRKNTYGSTVALGISFVVVAYAPPSRLPLPLLSNSSGRLRTSEATNMIHLERFVAEDAPCRIPRAAGVHPGEGSEQPLLAERELLAPEPRGHGGLGRADVGKPDPQIERTAERARWSDRQSCRRRARRAR